MENELRFTDLTTEEKRNILDACFWIDPSKNPMFKNTQWVLRQNEQEFFQTMEDYFSKFESFDVICNNLFKHAKRSSITLLNNILNADFADLKMELTYKYFSFVTKNKNDYKFFPIMNLRLSAKIRSHLTDFDYYPYVNSIVDILCLIRDFGIRNVFLMNTRLTESELQEFLDFIRDEFGFVPENRTEDFNFDQACSFPIELFVSSKHVRILHSLNVYTIRDVLNLGDNMRHIEGCSIGFFIKLLGQLHMMFGINTYEYYKKLYPNS